MDFGCRSTLTIDDVVRGGDQVLLRLGDPACRRFPEPVADILLAWIDNRTNMNTATNRDSRWLFPDGEPDNQCTQRLSAVF